MRIQVVGDCCSGRGTAESEGRCTVATCGYLSGHTDLSPVARQIAPLRLHGCSADAFSRDCGKAFWLLVRATGAQWGWRIGKEDDNISARGDLHCGIFTVPKDLAFSPADSASTGARH